MRYLSLFSGIEAATAAWHPLGWECAAVSEIEPFPCAVLAHHYPDVPNLGNVTKITEQDIAALGPVDVVVFGSPCQDLSVAGHRKGLINADGTVTRSGLFFTAINIFHWARVHCGARFALWENVPGAFSSNKGRDFGAVVEFMAGLDEVPVPDKGWGTEGVALGDNGLLEWATLDAQWFGVAQRRRRVFALLDTGGWASRQPILLEPEGLRGDSAPSREAGEGVTHPVAPCLGASGRGFERGGDTRGQDAVVACFGGNNTSGPIAAAAALNAKGGSSRMDFESETFCVTGAVTHALKAEGFDASEDGTGRGQPIVPVAFSCKDYGADVGEISPTLRSMNHSGSHANAGEQVVVAFNWNAQAAQLPSAGGRGTDVNDGLTRSQGSAVAYSIMPMNSGRDYKARETAIAQPLMAGGPVGGNQGGDFIQQSMQVRRLTPRECERLQGFPDDYTLIPYRNKPAADGPRYKALGNSMAVPVMAWIGKQLHNAVQAPASAGLIERAAPSFIGETMSLEQSVDRLSTLIEQLIKQLEQGGQGNTPAVPAASPTKPAAKEKPAQSSGTTNSSAAAAPAPDASGASTGLDYMTDIAPRFQALVVADRAKAVALIAKLKPGAKKMSEAVAGHDPADVLAQINELLGG